MRKSTIATLVLVIAALALAAQQNGAFTAARSGNWRDPGTWGREGAASSGNVPGLSQADDTATIPAGVTVNFSGALQSGTSYLNLTALTVNGTMQGTSNRTPINIQTGGDVIVGEGGTIGGSAAGSSTNNVNLTANGNATINGTVRGEGGSVGIRAGGEINVGGNGNVVSQRGAVNLVSSGGPVNVAAGGKVTAFKSVGIQAGPGSPVTVGGAVLSTHGNVVVNGTSTSPGNVTVPLGGSIQAPKGEVIIKADTLRVGGLIKGRTVQKNCKVVIIEPGGRIEGKGSEKDKVAEKEKAEPRQDPSEPAKKAEHARVTGSDEAVLDYSFAQGVVTEATGSIRVATGPLGSLDLRGNPPGLWIFTCPGPIEIFADEILTDPGVLPMDLAGPGPVLVHPSGPIFDVACLSFPDTIVYPEHEAEVGFLVTNMGNTESLFELTVTDSLNWFPAPPPWRFRLRTASTDADTLIPFPFPTPPWAIPDEDTNRLWLRAVNLDNPLEFYEESLLLPVHDPVELRDVSLALWELGEALPQETVQVQLWITNNGRLHDDFELTADNREGWPVVVIDPVVSLPPLADAIRTVELLVPPGVPAGFTNDLWVATTSLLDPRVAAWDTILVTVGIAAAAPPDAPAGTIRHRCWPNPFNPSVAIEFTVPRPGREATVSIHDVDGRLVRELPRHTSLDRQGRAVWDGNDRAGQPAASGVYFYRIACDGQTAVGKMILAR